MIRLYRAACEYLEALTEAIRNNEPQAEGTISQVEHAGQYEPDDMRTGNHWEPAWEDRARIGFRSAK